MISSQRLSFALCLMAALMPVLAVDLPKSMAFLPGVMGVFFYCAYQYGLKIHLGISQKVIYLCAGLFGLSALSLLWAMHFETSLDKVIQLATILPSQILLISLASKISRDQISPHLHLYAYGIISGCGLIIFEILCGGVIFNLVRGLPLDVAPQIYEYNRASVFLTLCSFSAIPVLQKKIPHILTPLMILTPLLITLYLSVCQTAQMMIVIGFLFLYAFPYGSKWAWTSLKAIILSLMLLSPFIVPTIYANYATDIVKIPMMANGYAGHRLEIWDAVSRYALQNPLWGYGVEVTRSITDLQSPKIFHGADYYLNPNHPHNFVIQIWIEFGLLGILLAMALVFYTLTYIQNRCAIAQQKILLPTMMSGLLAASTAYGMWQGMWLGKLFFVGAMCLMVCKIIDEKNDINMKI